MSSCVEVIGGPDTVKIAKDSFMGVGSKGDKNGCFRDTMNNFFQKLLLSKGA